MNYSTTLRLETSPFVFEATSHEVFFVVQPQPTLIQVYNHNGAVEAERKMFQKILMALDMSRGRLVGGIT